MTADFRWGRKLVERPAQYLLLAALVVAPLLFSPNSTRPFDLVNTSIVRATALLVIFLWLWGQLTATRTTVVQTFDHPIVRAVLLFLVAVLLSTLLSASPSASLHGSFLRNQGTYTLLACMVIFWVISDTIRSTGQIELGIALASLVGFLVSLYAIIQFRGLDSIQLGTSWDPARSSSTLGNPNFLGGFLILMIPLVLTKVLRDSSKALGDQGGRVRWIACIGLALLLAVQVWSWLGGPSEPIAKALAILIPNPDSASFHASVAFNAFTLAGFALMAHWARRQSVLDIGLGMLLLGALLAALVLTQSRGALLGFVASLLTLGLLYGAIRRSRLVVLGAPALFAVLAATSLAGSLLASRGQMNLCGNKLLGRIACPFQGGDDRIGDRPLIWEGVVDLAVPHVPIRSPSTGPDRWNSLRVLTGYGPESLLSVFPRFFPPALVRAQAPGTRVDRAHNVLLDTFAESGLLGVGAYLVILLVALRVALSSLLASPDRRLSAWFWTWMLGGALLAGMMAAALLGRAYAALGFSLGLLLGFWGFLALRSARPGVHESPRALNDTELPIMGITCALVGHFTQQQFSFATTPLRVYFWALLGLLVVLSRSDIDQDAEPFPGDASILGASPLTAITGMGVLTALLLAVPSVGFLDAASTQAVAQSNGGNLIDLLSSGLLEYHSFGEVRFESALVITFILTAVLASLMLHGQPRTNRSSTDRRANLPTFFLSCLTVYMVAVLLAAYGLVVPHGVGVDLVGLVLHNSVLVSAGLAILVVLVAELSGFSRGRKGNRVRALTSAAAAAVLVAIVVRVDIGSLRADRLSLQLSRTAGESETMSIANEITRIQPSVYASHAQLALAHQKAASRASNSNLRLELLEDAESAWKRAQELNPYEYNVEVALAAIGREKLALISDRYVKLQMIGAMIEHDRAALGLAPSGPELHVLLAVDLISRANLEEDLGLDEASRADAVRAAEHVQSVERLDLDSCLTLAASSLLETGWDVKVQAGLGVLHRTGCRSPADRFTGLSQELALQTLIAARSIAAEQGAENEFNNALRSSELSDGTLAIVMAMARRFLAEGDLPAAEPLVDLARGAWPDEVAVEYAEILQTLEATGR